jgi:Mg2+-importing ATPase
VTERGGRKFVGLALEELYSHLRTSPGGLSAQEARKRLDEYGPNVLARRKKRASVLRFLLLLRNPLVIILFVAALISGLIGEEVNAAIIFVMIFFSVALNYYQEGRAERAAEKLSERITTTATVLREGTRQEVRLSEVVPGDVVYLSAGDLVPADVRVVEARDFFVDESSLTGESFPAEKSPSTGPLVVEAIADRHSFAFLGTSVVSGTATGLVLETGSWTEYGQIARRLLPGDREAESGRGLRLFGLLIMQVTMALVLFVFFTLALLKHEVLESLLFAVALAVGLTPELLPMILTVNLSKGAVNMSRKEVIVKRLASIQDFGSMDVLCTDKTGTLTENRIKLILHPDAEGQESERVFLFSWLNSHHQTGIRSPLDDAILGHGDMDAGAYTKVDEVPFDFIRKRVSVVVEHEGERFLATKGAPEEVFRVCTLCEVAGGVIELGSELRKKVEGAYHEMSLQGLRVLGISCKPVDSHKRSFTIDDEREMIFLGFVAFLDPPKESAKEALRVLERARIRLKILTGDNEFVTETVCRQLGFETKGIVRGNEISGMTDEKLARVAEEANVFTRVTPDQKDRIIGVLKARGHVVGFLGDGINDAPSLKKADVGISVDTAVDVAKESADIILLRKDLTVLGEGVLEGRKTFGNTMKYIMMGTSSNFGNMFSAAGASVFLPFLPMLPTQILLNNLLYDMSELGIPTDNVDAEYLERPRRWDIHFIRDFMLAFGPISSIFDFLTFFVMIALFSAHESLFQTAWFIESLSTQTFVILVIRTRSIPFYRSHPSRILFAASVGVVAVAWIIPFTPLGPLFGFEPPPPSFLMLLVGMVATYLALVEVIKKWFYNRTEMRGGTQIVRVRPPEEKLPALVGLREKGPE